MLKKILLTLSLAFCVVLAGCGSPATLEDYMNTDKGKEEMAKIQEQADSMSAAFGSIDVSIKANNILYTCKFDQTFDANPFAEGAFDDDTIGTLKDALAQMESDTGISGCTMEYIFQDGSGTVLYQVKVDKNGIVE